jgi:hypothetical protein
VLLKLVLKWDSKVLARSVLCSRSEPVKHQQLIKKSNFRKVDIITFWQLWNNKPKDRQMKVKIISIPVQDQQKALEFYTRKLGFLKKVDVPLSEDSRWLTVVSNEEQDGPEVLLEPSPNHFEPARTYQKALFEAGIPYTQFNVDNLQQ